jgi:stage II sporulation protein D
VINGHGWGHGIGMSQWGADGYAQHGWSYTQILTHYYSGTTIERRPSLTVRILLVDGQRRVALDSDSPWQAVDGKGTIVDLPAGKLIVPASLVVSGQTLVSPLTFKPGTTPVKVGKNPYRGNLLVVSNGKKLQVVSSLPLDQYVAGVVGSEMPSSWPASALEAQAVAARSYARAELENVVTARSFDLYSDTRSQVYGGILAEAPSVTRAVAATANQVVVYEGKVATTYFSSSSGGRTVSAAEATGTAVPYLLSVPDPYDTLSPNHDWGPVLIDAKKAARALGIGTPLIDLQTSPGPSGHIASVTALGSTTRQTLSGSAVRNDLGLRSTWFQVGWLTLAPPPAPVTFGATTVLAGVARGLSGVSVEARTPAAAWQAVATVTPDATGAFSVTLKPQATTEYRLATGNVRAALIKVPVVPLVSAALRAGLVQGTVRPAPAGSAVQVQRQEGKTWATVAAGTTDTSGAFLIQAQLTPGAYRVRCAPGQGLSPGLSQQLLVSS